MALAEEYIVALFSFDLDIVIVKLFTVSAQPCTNSLIDIVV